MYAFNVAYLKEKPEISSGASYKWDFSYPRVGSVTTWEITWVVEIHRRSAIIYDVYCSCLFIPKFQFTLRTAQEWHKTVLTIHQRLNERTIPYICDWNDMDAADDGKHVIPDYPYVDNPVHNSEKLTL